MQINSVHLPRLKKNYGINERDLLNPKINIFVGAEILKMCFDKHGLNPNALTCYNGRIKNNTYGKEVLALLKEAQQNNGYIKTKTFKHKKLPALLKLYPFNLLAKKYFPFVMLLNEKIETSEKLLQIIFTSNSLNKLLFPKIFLLYFRL